MSLRRTNPALAIVCLVHISAFANDPDAIVNLDIDGVSICVSRDEVYGDLSPLADTAAGSDDSYTEVLLQLPPDNFNPASPSEILLRVANISAISGFSAAQQDLAQLSKDEPGRFAPIAGSDFFAVERYPQFEDSLSLGYDIVRTAPTGDEDSSKSAMHNWIVALNCRETEIGLKLCNVQRLHNDLAYSFSHWGDPAQIDSAVSNIELQLDTWSNNCASEN